MMYTSTVEQDMTYQFVYTHTCHIDSNAIKTRFGDWEVDRKQSQMGRGKVNCEASSCEKLQQLKEILQFPCSQGNKENDMDFMCF